MLIHYKQEGDSTMISYNDITEIYKNYAQKRNEKEAVLQNCAVELIASYEKDLGLSFAQWSNSRGAQSSYITCRVYERGTIVEKHPQQLEMDEEYVLKFLIGTVVDHTTGNMVVVGVELWNKDDLLYIKIGEGGGIPHVSSTKGDAQRFKLAIEQIKGSVISSIVDKRLD